MSNEISKAARDAVEAADNSEQLKLIAAALQAQQLMQAAQQPCQHQAPPRRFNAWQWLIGGATAAVVAVALALSAIAVAVGTVAVTCCLLILRGLWNDIRGGRR